MYVFMGEADWFGRLPPFSRLLVGGRQWLVTGPIPLPYNSVRRTVAGGWGGRWVTSQGDAFSKSFHPVVMCEDFLAAFGF